jgi:hypothetical protein
MAEEQGNPGGNTEQWRAFAHGTDPVAPAKRVSAGLIISVVVAVLIVAGLVWLALS